MKFSISIREVVKKHLFLLKNLQEKTTASNISVSVEILDERVASWLVLNMPVGMR